MFVTIDQPQILQFGKSAASIIFDVSRFALRTPHLDVRQKFGCQIRSAAHDPKRMFAHRPVHGGFAPMPVVGCASSNFRRPTSSSAL
jgi:hypothetical protein